MSTDQLSDLGVIVLEQSVKKHPRQIHIHPGKFAAGTKMIRIAVKQKKNNYACAAASQKTKPGDLQSSP